MGMTINAAHTAVGIKVLLVEDTASERFYIAELLHQQGFEVIESASAEEALERLNEHHIDLVVSDWRMPGMSGPELCHIIKSRPQPPYVLMLTANADTGFLIQGIESGADDYLPKPFAPAVLRVRLLAAVRLIELNQALARQNAALERAITEVSAANQQLQADLHQAALLQQSLLPAPMEDINGWHCLSRFASANMLAGDLFNIIRLDEQNLGFYLIDVAGHGSAAAMQAFSLAMMLSPCRCDWHKQTPAGLMSMLNQGFVDPGEQGQYATALIGKLNTQNGQLSLASAAIRHLSCCAGTVRAKTATRSSTRLWQRQAFRLGLWMPANTPTLNFSLMAAIVCCCFPTAPTRVCTPTMAALVMADWYASPTQARSSVTAP